MYNIAIIGAGQLGSRHLQGLKTANIEMSISIVDNNTKSLETAKERYEEVETNPLIHNVNYLANINELPMSLNLVIIATSSFPRAAITETLLKTKKIKNIVFEKFLFPRISNYEYISQLLIEYNVNAWVNCPRRMFPCYEEIKYLLKDTQDIHFSVIGGNWGLGCNSIHFIDVFSWIIGETDYTLDLSLLDQTIQESKRNGYIEFTGTMNGQYNSGKRFILTSNANDSSPTVFSIKTNDYDIIIEESKGKYSIVHKNGQIKEHCMNLLYQSQLTGVLAEEILEKGNCVLTGFPESSVLHVNFLNPILEFYNIITKLNTDICPIT